MKYIIELEDAPISVKNSHKGEAYDVYLAKKFNTVFFDAEGLRRLEPYESQSAYQKGYEAGLAEGRKQAEEHDGCQGCYYEPCGEDEEPCMSCKYRYKSQYRRADDKIRVGDEVIAESSEMYGNAVVTNANNKREARYIYANGFIGWDRFDRLTKTGRHFDDVEKLLEAMRKERRNERL